MFFPVNCLTKSLITWNLDQKINFGYIKITESKPDIVIIIKDICLNLVFEIIGQMKYISKANVNPKSAALASLAYIRVKLNSA